MAGKKGQRNRRSTKPKRKYLFGHSTNIPAILANKPFYDIIDIASNDATPDDFHVPYDALPAFWVYQHKNKNTAPFALNDEQVKQLRAEFMAFYHSMTVKAVECWGNPSTGDTTSQPSGKMVLQCFSNDPGITEPPASAKIDGSIGSNDAPYVRQLLGKGHFFAAGYRTETQSNPFGGLSAAQCIRMRVHVLIR